MYTAGIDIGGTNTRIALINDLYEIVERLQFPTDVNNPQATLQKIQDTVQGFSAESWVHVYRCLSFWKTMRISHVLQKLCWGRERNIPMCSF